MKRRGRGMSVKRLLPGLVAFALVLGAASAVAASSMSGAGSGTGRPVIGRPVAVPAKPLAGQRFTVSFAVTRAGTGAPLLAGKMVCDPSIAGRLISHAESFRAGTARVALVVPASAGSKLLRVRLTVRAGAHVATRVSTFRVQEVVVPSLTADTIFYNGTVLTMDPAQAKAEAVAVRGDRIVAVGRRAVVMRLRGPNTRMIDLGGRTLVPGFNDAHAHWIFGLSSGMTSEEAISTALRGGYTSVSEAWIDRDRLEALKALDAAGRLRVRVNAYLPVNNDAAERLGVWFGQYAQGQVLGPRLRIGGVKLFVDPCNTYQAFVSVPYRDRPGYYGEAFWTQQELNAIVEQLAAGGWQIASHVGGDRGLDMILTAYQAVLPGPDNGRRFRIEHLTIVRDDQIPVLKQLGILGVIQYEWGTSRDVPKIDRLPTPYSWGTRWPDLLAAGVRLVGSTDTPGTTRPEESYITSAMEAIDQVVTRVSVGGAYVEPPPWMLAKRITVEQALQGLTSAGAHATFEEKTKGTIGPGKLADLVILDQNPLTAPPENIRNIAVLATIVGGHAEYCATGANALCP